MPTRDRPRGQGSAGLRLDRAGAAPDHGGRGLQQCGVREVLACPCASSRRPGSPWPGSTSATSASTGGRPGTYRAGRRTRRDARVVLRRRGCARRRRLDERERLSRGVRRTLRHRPPEYGRRVLGPPATPTSPTTSWSTWPCASARGWPSAGSTRSSTSTAPAGCRLRTARLNAAGPRGPDGEGHLPRCGATAPPSRATPCGTSFSQETSPRLRWPRGPRPRFNVHDGDAAPAPSPAPPPEGEEPHVAEVSVWLDSYERGRGDVEAAWPSWPAGRPPTWSSSPSTTTTAPPARIAP